MLVVGSRLFYERAFCDNLDNHFELFYFDHHGFCENHDLNESAYRNLDDIVKEIEVFRRKIGLKKFLLFGHSGHAYMALEYTKAFSDHVLALVLCACSPDLSIITHQASKAYFDESACPFRKRIFENDMSQLKRRIETEPNLRFTHYVLCQKAKNWYYPEYDASWLWDGVPTHLPTLDFVWGKLFSKYDIKKDLEKASCPVLFLQGEFDFVAGPASLWNLYLPLFKNATIKIFHQSGHYPMVEEPKTFLEVLLEWGKKFQMPFGSLIT